MHALGDNLACLNNQVGLLEVIMIMLSIKLSLCSEFLLMDYLSHQKRLLPLIATTYALRIGMNHTKAVLRDIQKVLVRLTVFPNIY